MATRNPDGTKLDLKYLFKVEFKDGTTLIQNADDQSALEENRSCFFDVLKAVEQGKEPVTFSLEGQGHTYKVSLIDGHFEIDGVSFVMHEQIELVDFRILYFRVRDTHVSMGGDLKGFECAYRLGWQANEKKTGANHQHWIEIK